MRRQSVQEPNAIASKLILILNDQNPITGKILWCTAYFEEHFLSRFDPATKPKRNSLLRNFVNQKV